MLCSISVELGVTGLLMLCNEEKRSTYAAQRPSSSYPPVSARSCKDLEPRILKWALLRGRACTRRICFMCRPGQMLHAPAEESRPRYAQLQPDIGPRHTASVQRRSALDAWVGLSSRRRNVVLSYANAAWDERQPHHQELA